MTVNQGDWNGERNSNINTPVSDIIVDDFSSDLHHDSIVSDGNGGSNSGGSSNGSNSGSSQTPTNTSNTAPNYGGEGENTITKLYFPIIKKTNKNKNQEDYYPNVYSYDNKASFMTSENFYEKSSNLENYEWKELFEIGDQSGIFGTSLIIPYEGSWLTLSNADSITKVGTLGKYSLIIKIISDKKIFTTPDTFNEMPYELYSYNTKTPMEFDIGYGNINDIYNTLLLPLDSLKDENGNKIQDTDIFGDGINNSSNNFEIKIVIYVTNDIKTRVKDPIAFETSLKITKVKEEVDGEIRYRPYITYKPASKSDYFGDLSLLTNGGNFIETKLNTSFGVKSCEKAVWLKKNGNSVTDILNPKLYYVDDPNYIWFFFDTYNELESVSIVINYNDGKIYTSSDDKKQSISLTEINGRRVETGEFYILQLYNGNDWIDYFEFQRIEINKVKNRYIFKSLKSLLKTENDVNNVNSSFITLNLKNEENDYNTIDNKCLIDVKNNSNCELEFVNTKLKNYDTNEFIKYNKKLKKTIKLRFDLPGGIYRFERDYYEGILCAIFNFSGNVYGNLNVYYGTKKIFNGNSNKIINNILFRKFNNNDIQYFYLYDIKENIYGSKSIYIYLYSEYDIEGESEPFYYNKKITISLDSIETTSSSTTSSNVIPSNTTLEQKTLSYYEIDINKPEITSDSKIVYIDDSKNGKTHHYSFVSEIETEEGIKYYGLRARKRYSNEAEGNDYRDEAVFGNNIYDIGIDGLSYNVHAKVVPLKSRSENYNIYSFTNGEQLITLNQSSLGIYGSKDEFGDVTWNNILLDDTNSAGNEMLPSYRQSYSYIIENKIGSASDYNIRFTALQSHSGLKEISKGEIGTGEDVSVILSYTQIKTLSDGEFSYNKINNRGNASLLTYNINTDEGINTYEYSYSEINDINNYSDYDNLYKLSEEYVKVSSTSLNIDLFKTVVNKYYSSDSSRDDTIYYKYISSTNEYVKYSLSEVNSLVELPLNIYSKSYYYLKLSSYSISDPEIVKYKKDYEYIELDAEGKKNSSDEILYATDSYFPVKNKFSKDGSEEYYGYVYSKIETEDFESIQNINTENVEELEDVNINSLYVKQNYKLLENPSTNLILRYSNSKIPLYTLDSIIKSSIIGDDENIYSLDISGNTIYTNKDGEIIPLNSIVYEYNRFFNNSDNVISEYDILHDKERYSDYFIVNFGGLNIKNKISLKGNYSVASLNTINDAAEVPSSARLYIESEAYVDILTVIGRGKENIIKFLKNIKDYNVTLYTKKFKKIGVDDFKELKLESDNQSSYDKIYIYLSKNKDIETLKEIDTNTGLPKSVAIYSRKPVYTKSYDLNMSRNKDYFSASKTIVSVGRRSVKYSDLSSIYNSNTGNINTNNENIEQKVDQIKYYKKDISYYTYSENFVNQVSEFNTLCMKNPDDTQSFSYEPEIFFKSRYLYPEFSDNDGINIDINGSYYTNISVFDGKNGHSFKKMSLNTHLRTATKYSYEYSITDKYQVKNSDNYIYSLQPNQYNQYYIEYDGKVERLNEKSNPVSYFVSLESSYQVFSYYTQKYYSEYTGETSVHGTEYSYQFFDEKNKTPITVMHNNEIFGIIFEYNPNTVQYSDVFAFSKGREFIENEGNLFFSSYNSGTIGVNYTTYEYVDDYETINNELYYNSDYINDSIGLNKKYNIGFKPSEYEYEIVELKKFIFKNSYSFKSKYSERDYEVENISIEKPFVIGNSEKIEFDGTYTWVEPEYTNIITSDGSIVEIISKDGYWKKNYEKKSVPLTIASYNYYDKNDVSSINITYNFIPNSYILTAQINHPKISYNYLVNDTKELVRYSYIINGIEHDYPLDDKVTYSNGSYYGVIKEKYYINDYFGENDDSNITYTKVKLYRRKELVTNTNVKNIVNQDKFTSYEYFTYNQATPLTNEKIPVLYNTELIPAKTKRVQYWDVSKNSYSIKNVVSSYAYYSYKYIYETVPFKVASYIYTDEFTISNFNDLGTYVSEIGKVIGSSVDKEKESIEKLDTKLDKNINSFIDIYSTYNTYGINKIDTSISKLYENVYTLSNTSYSVLNNLKDSITYSINSFSNGNKDSVNEFKDALVEKISEQHSSIKDGFEKQTSTLENKLSDLHDIIHSDILGENSLKEEKLSYTIYTYTPIPGPTEKLISGYSVSSTTAEFSVSKGGNSIGEILSNIFCSNGTRDVIEYNDDNSYTVSVYPTIKGIGDILSNLTISTGIPKYNEFMVDLVPKLFSSIDFENASNIEYDDEGNVISRSRHNPTDIAKKCIMRADILWNELKKKGVVS